MTPRVKLVRWNTLTFTCVPLPSLPKCMSISDEWSQFKTFTVPFYSSFHPLASWSSTIHSNYPISPPKPISQFSNRSQTKHHPISINMQNTQTHPCTPFPEHSSSTSTSIAMCSVCLLRTSSTHWPCGLQTAQGQPISLCCIYSQLILISCRIQQDLPQCINVDVFVLFAAVLQVIQLENAGSSDRETGWCSHHREAAAGVPQWGHPGEVCKAPEGSVQL